METRRWGHSIIVFALSLRLHAFNTKVYLAAGSTAITCRDIVIFAQQNFRKTDSRQPPRAYDIVYAGPIPSPIKHEKRIGMCII